MLPDQESDPTGDLLYAIQAQPIALRCQTSPCWLSTCSDSGLTWPGVARQVALLAPNSQNSLASLTFEQFPGPVSTVCRHQAASNSPSPNQALRRRVQPADRLGPP